jgi:Bacteriocin-protection, YdeI or OmpD-Associated/Domain of unknown function (DUF1905)
VLLYVAEDTPGALPDYCGAMSVTFTTSLLLDDEVNATGIVVPPESIERLGAGKRPPVVITIGGYTYRSTVAVMGGLYMIPFNQEHRARSGLEPGAEVEVTLELDSAPRTVDVPADLAAALDAADARERFDALSYSVRKEHVRQVEDAKTPETRERRISKVLASVGG